MTDLIGRLMAMEAITANTDAETLSEAADRILTLERLDREAATYVESVICMRTDFTGEPPYVGWKGLGLALNEALDERDSLRIRVAELETALGEAEKSLETFATFGQGVEMTDGLQPEHLMRDRIVDWFGPSDFYDARTALAVIRKAREIVSKS